MSQHDENDTQATGTERQKQEQDRVRTGEREAMDGADMEEAIDHELDQKVEPGDDSRYEDNVDEVLTDQQG